MKRLKVLMSAYACEPRKGSESGVGWNMALEMAKYHHVWVLTRANNKSVIERELTNNPAPRLHFIYYDLPKWAMLWKRGGLGVQFYYIFWQICIYFFSKDLHKKIRFDLVHHVTFVRYWTPSFVSLLQAPFIWGPVGGGEPVPKGFIFDFGLQGIFFELLRSAAIALGKLNPFVLLTAKKSKIALAASKETAVQLKKSGVNNAYVLCPVACSNEEVQGIFDAAYSLYILFKNSPFFSHVNSRFTRSLPANPICFLVPASSASRRMASAISFTTCSGD